MERKLTTIFAVDVVGYSRLMGEDEDGTLDALKALRKEVVAPLISKHRGRIIKLMGDGLLAEFGSVVEAVKCAVEIQNGVEKRNEPVDPRRRIRLRIGINLGDVIVEGQDIYGDGVNVAARLEGLAPPGGICVSDTVHRHVQSRFNFNFDDLGAQKVKNIAEPIRVYRIDIGAADSAKGFSDQAPAIPAKPSIAVLPFDNMSGNPDQEFFCDGLAEDIITELSRDPDLFVIARNSSFQYRGQSPDIRQVAKELGVRYVLEGSARRAGNRIRLNVQLIEADTNRHIWAERYDRVIDHIFEIQDELTSTIQNTLLQKVRDADLERALRQRPANMDAYDHLQRAMGLLLRINREDNEAALREAKVALDLDSNYALAHAMHAWIELHRVWSGWTGDVEQTVKEGYAAAQKAVAADRNSYWGYAALGFAEVLMNRPQRALAAMNHALALNPNSADVHALRGMVFNFLGRAEEALADLQKAFRHNPHHPDWYLVGLGRSHYMLGQPNEAIPLLEEFTRGKPDAAHGRLLLVAVYVAAGRLEDAREEMSSYLKINPKMTTQYAAAISPMQSADFLANYLETLRKAGLPDE